MGKNLTLRLPDDLAREVQAVARVDAKSINETVRTALEEAIERRKGDPEFMERLARIIEEDKELLERLAR